MPVTGGRPWKRSVKTLYTVRTTRVRFTAVFTTRRWLAGDMGAIWTVTLFLLCQIAVNERAWIKKMELLALHVLDSAWCPPKTMQRSELCAAVNSMAQCEFRSFGFAVFRAQIDVQYDDISGSLISSRSMHCTAQTIERIGPRMCRRIQSFSASV